MTINPERNESINPEHEPEWYTWDNPAAVKLLTEILKRWNERAADEPTSRRTQKLRS